MIRNTDDPDRSLDVLFDHDRVGTNDVGLHLVPRLRVGRSAITVHYSANTSTGHEPTTLLN